MIYVLTCGEYSDYHIIMATTDEEKAFYFQRLYPAAQIEYFDDSNIQTMPLFSLKVWKKDGIVRASECDRFEGIETNKVYENSVMFNAYVQAKNEDTAKKIFFDLYTQYKAEKEGIS